MAKIFTLEEFGFKVRLDKYARQADGSVWMECGDNVVLSTAVASKDERDFMGFFPLIVEYREKTAAAGKIPGGYIKREGRLSDAEVLTSRLIDRPIRPLFPKYYFNEVQVISNVLSYDGKFPTGIMGIISSSLALTISGIPFLGPVGAVRVGRINNEWKFNLSHEEQLESDADIIIAGTKDGICMVEGNCNSLSEAELVEVLFLSHEKIKVQIDWQLDIKKEFGKEKSEVPNVEFWETWEKKISEVFKADMCQTLFADSKTERGAAFKKIKETVLENFESDVEAGNISKSQLSFMFESIMKKYFPDMLSQKGKRIDGRGFKEIRSLSSEVSFLPAVHGSSVFQRGETQALSSLTLGTAQDAQRVESLAGESERSFMLHYNFPPFATGEVRMIRGVGRREIGHGYLAERSFNYVLPSQEEFPYTIRSVVDILECNGSSSMATVCATTMSMMDAGVPIKDMVGGIAMGLMKDSSGKFHILTDIMGIEDAFGLMDFKVTGTDKGIMAVQMDIKAKSGLTKELLKEALEQAREARVTILDSMKQVLDAPRKKLSELAPRVSSFRVDQDKIGAIIGPSGKNIKEIISETGTQIDIDDSGIVRIYSKNSKDANRAELWVRTLANEVEEGTIFEGKVKKIAEFGLFVELVPGKDGLVHISSIPREKQRDLNKMIKVGDTLKVKVISVDSDSGRVRLVAPGLAK